MSAVVRAGRAVGRSGGGGGGRRRLLLRFPLPRLDAVFSHRQRSVDAVQFVVQAAGVAHGLALVVPAPQSGHPGTAVRARQAETPVRRLKVRHIVLFRRRRGKKKKKWRISHTPCHVALPLSNGVGRVLPNDTNT